MNYKFTMEREESCYKAPSWPGSGTLVVVREKHSGREYVGTTLGKFDMNSGSTERLIFGISEAGWWFWNKVTSNRDAFEVVILEGKEIVVRNIPDHESR